MPGVAAPPVTVLTRRRSGSPWPDGRGVGGGVVAEGDLLRCGAHRGGVGDLSHADRKGEIGGDGEDLRDGGSRDDIAEGDRAGRSRGRSGAAHPGEEAEAWKVVPAGTVSVRTLAAAVALPWLRTARV